MKVGVVVFPGSNCDHDAWYAVTHNLGHEAEFLWHSDPSVGAVDAVIVPGGFSYGDYLRCGAIAAHSPVMRAVREQAAAGVAVLGICNGFQVLTETGLLPGVLLRNAGLRFICRDVLLRVENDRSSFTRGYRAGQVVRMPVAHNEGNYFADPETISRLEGEGRVAFRYCAADGTVNDETNPNGSQNNIAGILDERGRVLGLMPHPERLADPQLGGTDGRAMFEGLLAAVD